MHLAVLIKQVPGTTKVEIDPVRGTLRRDGVAAKLNPYDLFALEAALEHKDRLGARVTAITMGPPQATAAVREAVYMGCDDGFVLSDRRFAGADVLATSRTLAAGLAVAARAEGVPAFDLVLCGKQTTDGDTAQVGPETAERLGVPHVANVLAIRDVADGAVTLDANMGDYDQTLRLPLPALVTLEKDANSPRLPSVRRKYALQEDPEAAAKLVRVLSFDDFEGADLAQFGLNGSPTQVERIFPPEPNGGKVLHTGTAAELGAVLVDELVRARRLERSPS